MKQIGYYKTEKVGAASDQRPGRKIRAVVHFLHALQHARLGFFADVGVVAEGFGDGNDGDAQVSRNVFEGDSHIRVYHIRRGGEEGSYGVHQKFKSVENCFVFNKKRALTIADGWLLIRG